ncbi:unnamed protein product, partial [marine sediment metagenome]
MAGINNLKELNSLGRNLEQGDYIYFHIKEKIIEYSLIISHFSCLNEEVKTNDYVFILLGFNE